MTVQTTLDRASEWSAQALEAIQAANVAPTPEAYAVWYASVSGQNPDIARAIEELTARPSGIGDQDVAVLHDRFFGSKAEEEALRAASRQTQALIGQVHDILTSAGDSSREYCDSLSSVNDRLDADADEAPDMAALMNELLQKTSKAIEENRSLEEQLRSSAQEVNALRKDYDSVRREARTDGLTGIPNRKAFDENLLAGMKHSERTGDNFCLVLADVDHFKKFNDEHGHQVGDQVLKLVANILKGHVGEYDLPCRYGGEEFAILVPEKNLGQAIGVAENVRKALATKDLVNRNGNVNYGRITMSFGVANYREGDSPSDIIERADEALYKAKRGGRNRVEGAFDGAAPAAKPETVA